jgi:predicted dehydrogenase
MNQKKRYKLGIIGIGVIAETRILPAAEAVGEFDIAGAYDVNSDRLEYISKTYSIPGCSSLNDLFAKKCDAVYIATPNCDHVPMAVEALRNNVAVLLEKPCADTLDAAERLAGEVRKSSKPLLVAYMHKWNRHNQKQSSWFWKEDW